MLPLLLVARYALSQAASGYEQVGENCNCGNRPAEWASGKGTAELCAAACDANPDCVSFGVWIGTATTDPGYCALFDANCPDGDGWDADTTCPTPTIRTNPNLVYNKKSPSASPTQNPSSSPTRNPSISPSSSPTKNPTASPITSAPSKSPTKSPTHNPSISPTKNPTSQPTSNPSAAPTSVFNVLPICGVSATLTATQTIKCDTYRECKDELMCLRSVSLLNCGALSACYGAYADVTPVSGFYLEATSKQSGKYLTVAIYSTASIAVKGVKCGDTESCFGANILFEGNMEIEKIECDGERACQGATFYFNAGAYVDVEFKCAKTSSCLGCTVIVDGGVPISCGASVARAVSAGDEIDSEQPGVQMTTAEIAGISIVSVLAVLLIVTVAVCCFVRRIRKMERRVIEQEKQYLDVHVAKQTAAKEGGSLVGRNEAEASGVEMTSATFHD